MLHFIGHVIFGLIVGVVAKLLLPGHDPGGFIVTALIGMAGAALASFLGKAVGFYKEGEKSGFFFAILGSIVLLLLYRILAR